MGNVAQIDANLTEITSGLSVFIRAFRKSVNAGMLTLTTGVRSEIATEAELLL